MMLRDVCLQRIAARRMTRSEWYAWRHYVRVYGANVVGHRRRDLAQAENALKLALLVATMQRSLRPWNKLVADMTRSWTEAAKAMAPVVRRLSETPRC